MSGTSLNHNNYELISEEENYLPSSSSHPANCFRVLNVTFPLCPVFHPELFQSAFSFRPETGDVILTSYPKCDTKVIEVILWKLLYPESDIPQLDNLTNRYLPCIEMVGLRQALSLADRQEDSKPQAQCQRPKLIKTYLPFHLVPFYSRAKYVYVVRNPWDASMAYHKFLKLVAEENTDQTFDAFFDKFLAGDVPYGDFFEHVMLWQKYVEYENVLLLSYDQVKSNPRGSLFIIAAFLGDYYIDDLVQSSLDGDLANSILKYACPDMDIKRAKGRKSVIWTGRAKDKCSEEQMKLLESKIHRVLDNTGVEHLWTGLLKKDR